MLTGFFFSFSCHLFSCNLVSGLFFCCYCLFVLFYGKYNMYNISLWVWKSISMGSWKQQPDSVLLVFVLPFPHSASKEIDLNFENQCWQAAYLSNKKFVTQKCSGFRHFQFFEILSYVIFQYTTRVKREIQKSRENLFHLTCIAYTYSTVASY